MFAATKLLLWKMMFVVTKYCWHDKCLSRQTRVWLKECFMFHGSFVSLLADVQKLLFLTTLTEIKKKKKWTAFTTNKVALSFIIIRNVFWGRLLSLTFFFFFFFPKACVGDISVCIITSIEHHTFIYQFWVCVVQHFLFFLVQHILQISH